MKIQCLPNVPEHFTCGWLAIALTGLSIFAVPTNALFAQDQRPSNKQTADQEQATDKKDNEKKPQQAQPASRTERELEGWTIRVDDRLLAGEQEQLGRKALRFLEAKLFELKSVVPAERVKDLQKVKIVLDHACGDLRAMQYHPSAGWLQANGYSPELEKCVHLPRAVDVASRRNINEQPWVILHELAHAYHDQFLGFDDPTVIAIYEEYRKAGRGESTLLHNGKRVKHYGLTNHKEFFAEMTESFFGSNDFFPFNRAELIETEPEIHKTLTRIWIEGKAQKR